MAISSATIKKQRESASASNNNQSASHASSSSSSSSSNDYLGASMEKANGNASSNISYENKPKGADDKSWETVNSSFTPSDESTSADEKRDSALGDLDEITHKEQIISDDVMDVINSQFVVPSEVTEADAWLSEQLKVIQSGKTSYSDSVRDMIDKIMNREKFSYDVDTDPLFQQALASAMNSGKQAMQDTIGQASALTGGYGSTYATTAGNQAYNSFIEDAYDNLPEYYQMALNAYQMEGEEMYRQYSMLSTEDEKEYNRNITAYDATYAHRNQVYNEAYTQYRDSKSDAFAMANLQLTEHGQRVSDAYNYYAATSDYADTMYQRDYSSWMDSVNNAWQAIQMGNSDYWNQSNQDFTASENAKSRAFQASESAKQRAFQASENQKNRDFQASENALNREASQRNNPGDPYSLTQSEANEIKNIYLNAGGGQAGWEAVIETLSIYGKAPQNDSESAIIANYLYGGGTYAIDWETVEFTKEDDTVNGYGFGDFFGHIDPDDTYMVNGHEYTSDELKELMEDAGLSEDTIDDILSELSWLDAGETYTHKDNK